MKTELLKIDTYIAGEEAFAWAKCLMVEKLIGIKQMESLRAATIYDRGLRRALMEKEVCLTGKISVITVSGALLQMMFGRGRVNLIDMTRAAGVVLRDGDFNCDILDIAQKYGLDPEDVRVLTGQSIHQMITMLAVVALQRARTEAAINKEPFPKDYMLRTGLTVNVWMPPECLVVPGEA